MAIHGDVGVSSVSSGCEDVVVSSRSIRCENVGVSSIGFEHD